MATRAKPKLSEGDRLIPPKGGVTVRMYRIGHGDCFLLAFSGKNARKPVYVLIDCGYKPGSPSKIDPPTHPDEIAASIMAATGGRVDVAVMTHEHQDHVNAITEGRFAELEIGETWVAWTEDPNDDVAKDLRKKFKDQLLGLVAARNRLALAAKLAADSPSGDTVGLWSDLEYVDGLLAMEFGLDDDLMDSASFGSALVAAASDPERSQNKIAMKLFKDKAKNGPRFLRPHESVFALPGSSDVRVYVMGPPRDRDLTDADPEGDEEFHLGSSRSLFGFLAGSEELGQNMPPFIEKYCVPWKTATSDMTYGRFFANYYGDGDDPKPVNLREAVSNAKWRRIDTDWLKSALALMIKKNNATNNTSLVLAFELGKGGKVLLFAADAQRSNWLSWADGEWKDDTEKTKDDDDKIDAKELLSRTVLYKVGHHGSHNATLNGTEASDYPCLGWMGRGKHAREFTAMITAVRAWAETQKGWDHPQKAIKDALLAKCAGRVFQTDTPLEKLKKQGEGAQSDAFLDRVEAHRLFFDYTVKR